MFRLKTTIDPNLDPISKYNTGPKAVAYNFLSLLLNEKGEASNCFYDYMGLESEYQFNSFETASTDTLKSDIMINLAKYFPDVQVTGVIATKQKINNKNVLYISISIQTSEVINGIIQTVGTEIIYKFLSDDNKLSVSVYL